MMEMPDEKQSGIYGLKKPLMEEDEMVESLALDESQLNRGGV
jgi:hypothetical protein